MFKFLTTVLLSISFPVLCFANNAAYFPALEQQRLNQLSSNPTWLKLLHYEKADTISGYKSAINSPRFFLSENGATHARSELVATINAFNKNKRIDNDHAVCKFRGRYFWLSEQIPELSPPVVHTECTDYNKWSTNNSVSSLSLVFATGYLGNPASYYGHLLLKLNSPEHHHKTKLEDVSVNFGAVVPENENPIVYVLKGLLGGYDAGFTHIGFYFHNHNYGENEKRDMWEYELDLPEREIQLITGHTWEIIKHEYTYFFLDKNCAYRIAEILEISQRVKLVDDSLLWLMPQEIIQQLNKLKHDGKPVIKSVTYHPSRQSRFYALYSKLSPKQQAIFLEITENISLLNTQPLSELDTSSQSLIVDTLIHYYQYIRDPAELAKDKNNIKYHKVLAKRFQLPPGSNKVEYTSNSSPHLGRKASRISLSVLNNEKLGTGQLFEFRPSYYDSLDTDYGHIPNAHLSMAHLSIAKFGDDIFLRNLDIVKIESLNQYSTGLKGDENNTWRLSLGLTQKNLSCNDCLVAFLRGDTGYSYNISEKLISGILAGGSLQSNNNKEGNVFVRLIWFANINFTTNIKLRLESEVRHYNGGHLNSRVLNTVHTRFRLSENMDFRLSYIDDDSQEIRATTGLYW